MPQRIPGYDSARMLAKMAVICCCSIRYGNVWTGGTCYTEKNLPQVYSHYPCEKPLAERVFVKAG